MKIGALSFQSINPLFNLGDAIQTLAVSQHLPSIDVLVDRETISSYDGEECAVVMNGWFSHNPENWPPSNKIIPIFFGFHVSAEAVSFYKNHVNYFKRFQPIGCRDISTVNLMKSWGVDAFLSHCCTLTFPKRAAPPKSGSFIFVDVERRLFPYLQPATQISHNLVSMSAEEQLSYARRTIDFYSEFGSYMVTSRIHAAMPALAMGLPILFVGSGSGRTNILSQIGVPAEFQWRKSLLTLGRMLMANRQSFFSTDLEPLKARIATTLKEQLRRYGVH